MKELLLELIKQYSTRTTYYSYSSLYEVGKCEVYATVLNDLKNILDIVEQEEELNDD